MIPCFVRLFIVGILFGEPRQRLFAERQIIEFVLENDAGVEQAVLDDVVTLDLLLVRERNLRQIIFTGVWIGSGGVRCQRVGCDLPTLSHCCSNGVGRFFPLPCVTVGRIEIDHCTVDALPVVDILTLSPLSLESDLALADGLRIIEVPQSLLSAGRRHRRLGGIVAVTLCALLLYCLLGFCLLSSPLLLTFFFLQSLDDTVDGLIALFLG